MKNLFLLLAIGLLIASCSNVSTKSNDTDKELSELELFQAQVKDVVPNITDISSVATFIEMSGADFMPQLINDPHSVEKYKITNYMAAANLGIYTADVVYQGAYSQAEGAQLSYAAAKDLAYFIGVGEAFDDIFLQRIEEGLGAQDSVLSKLNEALANSQNILTGQEQAGLFTSILIGSTLEKLYILNNIIFNYPAELPDESKLLVLRQTVLVLAMQIQVFDGLSTLFETYKPETDGATYVFGLMKEVKDIYATIELKENIQTVEPKQLFENQKLLTAFEKIKEIRKVLIIEE